MGKEDARHGENLLSRYLLDTTVLISHLRGDFEVRRFLSSLVAGGHDLATTCVNVAEIERGIRPKERRATSFLLSRLVFLVTTREAATRAGRYQAEWKKRGQTLHTADALIAGTARAHGAIIVTDNRRHFPMRDVKVVTSAGG